MTFKKTKKYKKKCEPLKLEPPQAQEKIRFHVDIDSLVPMLKEKHYAFVVIYFAPFFLYISYAAQHIITSKINLYNFG